ncbi:hypothetical protein [Streptomyces sp. SudanB66_2053]|uniref:hypothetical protein n=1 Tax=Streptomyces sp. SudanB66_2053 TaxID=3035277 RepID=UPI003F54F8EB
MPASVHSDDRLGDVLPVSSSAHDIARRAKEGTHLAGHGRAGRTQPVTAAAA